MGDTSAAAASLTTFSFGFLPPVSEKLSRSNFNMWHAQVSSTLKGAQYDKYIRVGAAPPSPFLDGAVDLATGKKGDVVPNPAYEKWVIQDSQVLSYLFSSLSKEVFAQVSSATTSADLWAQIQGHHASQSRARIVSTRMALATASKGASSVADYFVKMKGLADDMAAVGKKLEDEDLVTYILMGLDEDYESVVTAVTTRVEPITVPELYAQLISHEQRKGLHPSGTQASANTAMKGGRNTGSSNNSSHDRGGRGASGVVSTEDAAAAATTAPAAPAVMGAISNLASTARSVARRAILPFAATSASTTATTAHHRRLRPRPPPVRMV